MTDRIVGAGRPAAAAILPVLRAARSPELVIRGRSPIQGSSAPLVDVDGRRAADV